jgi:hypothetical protein
MKKPSPVGVDFPGYGTILPEDQQGGWKMKIRPGRTRSLIAGVLILVVMGAGLIMMGGFPGFGPFAIIWVVIGLAAAGMAFYNAFSKEGLPLYEVDHRQPEGENYCPNCGRPVGRDDHFCKHCGHTLRQE